MPYEHCIFSAAKLRLQSGETRHSLDKIKSLLARRHATQPTNQPSCGSVFKNPVGHYAAQLIESVGLKGARCNDAEISVKHANFIVNHGQASASDVLSLVDRATAAVYEKYGIRLESEMRVIGDEM